MDMKIKYYVDLLNKLQQEVEDDKEKVINFETMIIKEKTLLAHLPYFKRLLSGSKQLILDLENNVKLLEKGIEDKKSVISSKVTEMVSVGLLNLDDNLGEMTATVEMSNFYNKICQNILSIHNGLISAVNDIVKVYEYREIAFKNYRHQAFNAANQNFVYAYSLFIGAIGKVKEINRLVELTEHVSCEKHPSDFQKNYKNICKNLETLEKDVLQVKAAYSKTKSDPEEMFMREKTDLIHLVDSVFRNLADMTVQEFRIYESRYNQYADIIKTTNAARKSNVLAMIREQYSLNVF